MKFAGYQVAYVVWGFVLILLLLATFIFVIGSMLMVPLWKWQRSPLINALIKLWPSMVISLCVYYSQELFAKFAFVLDKKSFSFFIKNRNVFHVTSYFLFFFNIILGLFSCILRIIYGLILGVLFLGRLQKCLLPRHFEELDPGYYAYLGYLVLEHSYTSPVIYVASRLFKEDYQSRALECLRYQTDSSINSDQEGPPTAAMRGDYHWIRARNKWQLAKILLENPSLIRMRKRTSQPSVELIRPETSSTTSDTALLI